jgi:hypothetical protein
MYQRLAEVRSERVRTGLQAGEETVRRNQQLIKLRDDMPCELPWEELAARKSDAEELRRLYGGWGFNNLLRELPQETPPKMEDLFQEPAHAGG